MHPRYNSRHPMTKSHRHWIAALFAVVLALCAPSHASDWTQPASQLAHDVVAITGPGAASISYRNQSTLAADQMELARRAIENQLHAAGVRTASAGNAAFDIRITFSENAQSYVWIAEVVQGSETRVVITTAERPSAVALPSRPATISVRKTLLWSQPAQLLDLVGMPAGSEPIMLVLDPNGVILYRKSGAAW